MEAWIQELGRSMIKSTSISIGDESYEWSPFGFPEVKVKGPRVLEWRCKCGYHILDSVPGLDPPNICPMCGQDHYS
jgi:hypothetical protein